MLNLDFRHRLLLTNSKVVFNMFLLNAMLDALNGNKQERKDSDLISKHIRVLILMLAFVHSTWNIRERLILKDKD